MLDLIAAAETAVVTGGSEHFFGYMGIACALVFASKSCNKIWELHMEQPNQE